MSETAERFALILDDNDANRMLLKFAMSLGNVVYDEAESGEQALTLWEPGKYGIAFVDIELPGINGMEVVRHMRQGDQQIAIIVCSTNDEPIRVERCIKAGCDMFLVKPFQFDTLLTLAKVMNASNIRELPEVLVIDNQARSRWEPR